MVFPGELLNAALFRLFMLFRLVDLEGPLKAFTCLQDGVFSIHKSVIYAVAQVEIASDGEFSWAELTKLVQNWLVYA